MKKIIYVLPFLPLICSAQIEIRPKTGPTIVAPASVFSNGQPMTIGPTDNDLSILSSGGRNVGIGTIFRPGDLSSPVYYNDGKLHIRHYGSSTNNSAYGGPHLILDSSQEFLPSILRFRHSLITDNPGPFNQKIYTRSSRYWDMLAFSNGSEPELDYLYFKNNNLTQSILSLKGDGMVGILTDSPSAPLHVYSALSSTNGFTGAFMIGMAGEQHLTFDNNEINSYHAFSNGTTLYLNDESSGNVQIGGSTESDLVVTGFTQLGSGTSHPNIKMKKLSGLLGTSGTQNVTHGLMASKILGMQILLHDSTNGYFPASYERSNFYYEYRFNETKVIIDYTPNFNNETYSILITYEE